VEIVWRQVALIGLEHARDYIAEQNPSAARHILEDILAEVERLAKMPNMGRPGRVEGTRELVVVGTPYVVAYTVFDNQLNVLAVQHGAQEWPLRL
jgi:toxin ParE1/3/4